MYMICIFSPPPAVEVRIPAVPQYFMRRSVTREREASALSFGRPHRAAQVTLTYHPSRVSRVGHPVPEGAARGIFLHLSGCFLAAPWAPVHGQTLGPHDVPGSLPESLGYYSTSLNTLSTDCAQRT